MTTNKALRSGFVIVLILFIITYLVFSTSEMFGFEWAASQTSWAPVPKSNDGIKFPWTICALGASGLFGAIIGLEQGS